MNVGLIDWLGSAILLGGLLWLSIIDWRTYRLPNLLTKPLIVLGLLYHFHLSLDAYPYLLGAIVGYAAFWTLETTYRLIRKKEGLGRGDAKLLALGGAWCGAVALPFIVLLASSAGLVYVMCHPELERKTLKIPFGPFLAAGIAITFIALKFT